MPRYFAAAIAMHYAGCGGWHVSVCGGWHVSVCGGGVDFGPNLVDGQQGQEVASMGGGESKGLLARETTDPQRWG